jgi:hypothetical protein
MLVRRLFQIFYYKRPIISFDGIEIYKSLFIIHVIFWSVVIIIFKILFNMLKYFFIF